MPTVYLSAHLSDPNPASGADTAAGATGIVIIDASCNLTANTTLSAQWQAGNGAITLGGFNLTFNRPFVGDQVPAFSVTGAGRVTFAAHNQTIKLWWYGPNGTGAVDDSATLRIAAAHGLPLELGRGTFAVAAGVAIPLNTDLIGESGATQIQNIAGSVTGITLVGNNRIVDIAFIGYGSQTSGHLDSGIVASGANQLAIERCSFSGFRGEPIRLGDVNTVTIRHCQFINNLGSPTSKSNPASETSPDILIQTSASGSSSIVIAEIRCAASEVTPKATGVFISQPASSGSPPPWQEVIVADSFFNGYSRGGVYFDNEYFNIGVNKAPYEGGKAIIRNCQIYKSGQEAIKIKGCWFVEIMYNYIEIWEIISPEIPGNLQGGIHVNNGGHINVSNNQLYNDLNQNPLATNGIRIQGNSTTPALWALPPTETDPNYDSEYSLSSSLFVISGNQIDGAGQPAIFITDIPFQTNVVNNQARNCAGFLRADGLGGTPDRSNNLLTVAHNNFRGGNASNSSTSSGIQISNSACVTIDGNVVIESGAYGAVIASTYNLIISNNTFCSNNVSNGIADGIRVGTSNNVTIIGNRCTSVDTILPNLQKYGLSFSSGNTGSFIITDNDFSQNVSGPINTLNMPISACISGNIGFFSSSFSWTPGPIPAGSSTSVSITIAGASPGADRVDIGIPGSGNGGLLEAWVSAVNTVTLQYFNQTGVSITPSSGNFLVEVTRKS